MLRILIKNRKIVQNTGVSFAVFGTVMHAMNVAHLTSANVSQTWSMIAIIGFMLTMSGQVNQALITRILNSKFYFLSFRHHQTGKSTGKDDIVLP